MTKSKAFLFNAADYLSDANVQMMTLEQEGIYIRLLAYCWLEGSIPSDRNKLALLCKCHSNANGNAIANVMAMPLACFVEHPTDPSKLIHKRLEEERQRVTEHKSKRAEAGRKGAEKRWGSKTYDGNERDKDLSEENSKCHSNAIPLPMAKDGYSNSNIIDYNNNNTNVRARAREHDPNFKPPTLEQVVAYGGPAGVPASECEKFYNHYATQNWIKANGHPLAGDTWKLKLMDWHKQNRTVNPGGFNRRPLKESEKYQGGFENTVEPKIVIHEITP